MGLGVGVGERGQLPFQEVGEGKNSVEERMRKMQEGKAHLLIQEIRSLNLSLGKRGFSSPRK